MFLSTDGAMTYKAANLNLSCNLSSETTGERLVIDPARATLPIPDLPGGGSTSCSSCQGNPDGLERSLDGGLTWTQVTAWVDYLLQPPLCAMNSSCRASTAALAPRSVGGQAASKTVYVTYIKHDETTTTPFSAAVC